MDAPNLVFFIARLIVEELVRLGVREVGVAPGSRSAPLAESAATHPALDITVHPDERGLAFHMLGRARGSGRATAVVTTSGTAATNLFPAVAEAHHSNIPLILLTADRPHELRDCGANQATDQVKLFGGFVRAFIELPAPDEQTDPRFILSAVDEAFRAATSHPKGPVHLNCLFREPLAPIEKKFSKYRLLRRLGDWPASGKPWVRLISADRPDGSAVEMAANTIKAEIRAPLGIMFAGALDTAAARAVADLAAHLKWPLLPDLQSGLRLGVSEEPVVSHADLLLCAEEFKGDAERVALLQFGSRFVTRRFLECAASPRTAQRILVDDAPHRIDPSHSGGLRVVADAAAVARALIEKLPPGTDDRHVRRWADASARVERLLESRFSRAGLLSEPAVAWHLSRCIPPDHAWFVGNSLPVRLAATFSSARSNVLRVFASRGLSGIDGQVATASGIAEGLKHPLTALIGDLTLLHDLNSLAFLARAHAPVTLVVINNDGGGIFSLLPIAETSRGFERVFAAPHGLRFRAAAELFGLRYAAPSTPREFLRAWTEAVDSGTSSILEIRTRRRDTARAIRSLQQSAARIASGRG